MGCGDRCRGKSSINNISYAEIDSVCIFVSILHDGNLTFNPIKTTKTYTYQAAWNYYDNQKNTSDSFSKEEQEAWNTQKKASADEKMK